MSNSTNQDRPRSISADATTPPWQIDWSTPSQSSESTKEDAKPWAMEWAKPWEMKWGPHEATKNRRAVEVIGDVGKSLAGAAVSAAGAVSKAAGRAMQVGGRYDEPITLEEARRQAEKDGWSGVLAEVAAIHRYESANRMGGLEVLGRGVEQAGDKITRAGDAVRDSRSLQAREAARKSTPDGDLTKPSTWTMGEDPSVEGVVHVGAEVLGSMAGQVGAAIATRGRSAVTQMLTGATVGAAQVGGSAMDEARQYLESMDDETLMAVSPVYRDLLQNNQTPAEARALLIRKAENTAASYAAPVGAVGGQATAALLGKPGEALASRVMSTAGKALLLGVLGATEEGLQEVAEGVATRAGINKAAGTDRSLTEGTFAEAVLGAKGGGTVGAARGALAGLGSRQEPAQSEQVDPWTAFDPAAAPQTHPQAPQPDAEPQLLRSPDQPTRARDSGANQEQQQIGARLAELEIEAQMRQLMPWEEYERADLVERLDVDDQAPASSMDTDWGMQASRAVVVEPDPEPMATTQPQVGQAADSPAGALALQNRDRSRAASVAQMADIARNPDYMRLATSRTPEAGAPMVFAVGDDMTFVPQKNGGRTDVAVMSDGQRVPFRYAVVEASQVQPSNLADGSRNPLFDGEVTGTLKALNNGRVAGLRAAYEQGNADRYRAELIADAQAHGVPVEVIQRTRNPILVRVYSEQSNTPDMAAKSQGQSLGMSPTELARQDAQHIDTSVLAVYQPAEVNSAANRDFVRAFVGRLNRAGQDVATLMTADGILSQAGRQRLQAALMQAAYGDADLVAELFDSLDTDIKAIGESLKAVAGEWANMRDSVRQGLVNPQVDLTENLLQAVHMVRRARAERRSLHDMTMQPDLMTGAVPDPLTLGMLRMFYRGAYLVTPRGREAVIGMLRDYVRAAMTTTAGADMFGDQVSPTQILEGFNEQGEPNAQTATQDRGTEPSGLPNPGFGPDQSGPGNQRHDDDAGGQAAGPAGPAEQQAQRRGAQVAAEPRIEDAGEQLYANRRNFTGRGLKWEDVRDLNDTLKVKEVTKAKVWPRPDYEKLVADGMPQVVARLVKQVYDGISAGPMLASGKAPTDADLQRYIDTLSKVREGLFAFVNDGQRVANFAQGVLATIKRDASAIGPVSVIDMAREAMDPQGVATVLLRQVWPEQFAEGMPTVGRFRRGSDAHQELAIIGGNKALGAMQFVRDDLRKWVADLEKGWPAKREAWQVQGYRVLGPDEYRLDQYEGARGTVNYIRPVQGRGSWSRSEPFTGGKFALVLDGGSFAQEFDTREAAIEAAREKVKRQAGAGQDVRGTNIEEAERTGPARRQEGEDITSQRLMDTFGFRGVNFGREGWIKQAERQAYLNQAFDGLMDLAEVLGVPPKAMSLDGKLGIAFGAQGKGRFAAHFVPGYNEINLTRTKGAGTLAHEWGHALDHHFALQAGLEKDAEPFLSEHASKREKTDRMVFEGGRYVARKDVPTFGDGIRPEMVRAFREIYQAMTKRNESPGEAAARRQHAQESAGRRLTQWLQVARGRIEQSAASNKADLLAEFDQHAEKLRQGDTGDGYEQAGKQTFSTRVAAVRNLIKDATGRVWSLDETNGLESAASYVRSLAGKQDADGAHEPQKVATQYKGDSRAMDAAKGGKAYWSTPTEMFARAFELYVHDTLSQRGQRNTFLTDAEQRAAKPAQIPDTSSPTARAGGAMRDLFLYPVGQERQALRQAFDALVGQIKTRETEQGVTLFSRKDQPYTDRNGPDSTPTARDHADIEGLETIVDDGNRGAINAGSARRAREVHPFRWVRLPDLHGLGAIASAFGKRVVGFDVTAEVLSRDFGFFNGVTRPGRDARIFINARSDRPHLAVLGHEMAHQLKRDRPDLFQDLVQAIRPYVKAREYGEGFARSAVARYSYPQGASQEQRDAAVREEFIGEVLSDGFMDPGFWRAVGDHNPSLLQRLAAMVQRMIESIREATGYTARTSQYLSDYERVMAIAGRVMADYGLSVPGLDGQAGGPVFNRQGEAMDSPAFRSWFGDSKVVDEQGRPRVVYHGTRGDFSAFKPARVAGVASGTEASAELGHFFSDDLVYVDGLLEVARNTFAEGANVMPVYLALKNPKVLPMQKIQDIEESWTPERVRRYRKQLERLGHDGIIFRGRNASEYVAFRPEQVKSAVGNRGTFDPESQDVRFNRNERNAGDQGTGTSMLTTGWARAKARVQELTSPAAIDRLLYEFQDKLIDLRRLRAHIQKLGGTITDLNDAYLGEELYHKRLAKRTADFLDKELKPLLADMRARAVKLPELERYLHARHAPEANRVLAERNPNQSMLDTYRQEAAKTVRELERQLQRAKTQGSATTAIEEALAIAQEESAMWIGAQAFTGPESKRLALSGMSDEEAKAHIAGLTPDKRKHLERLAAMVDQMQAKTLGELESYGLMDRATLNAWRSTYKHYVPLHRDEAKADSDRHPIGQGYSVKGSGIRSRVGSNEKVTNILAHIAMQREAALTRGEKNLVVKKLYLMAAQNPDEEVWRLDAPPKIKTVDPRNGTVRTTIDPTYKHRPNVLMVRIAGRDRSIVFNEHNPSAVRLAESMKNLDIGDLHVVLGLTAKGTRWFASVNTQYNPIFGLVNFARDVQAAMLQLSTTPLAGEQKAVASNVFKAMRAIYRQRRGKASRNNEWTALWDEFENVGGTTGYRDLFADADDRAKALAKELAALDRGQVSKAAHAVVDWLSHYNEVMENSVRLAAYKVALDQGMSKERAASLAKNLTVNFNRKGRQTRELGALYAFFNAALQGTARMVETLKGPIGRRIMFGGVALGAINTLIGMAMMGGDGEDEPDNWDKIPDFIKQRSLIIPMGREDYLTIPMPLGYHVFPNIGRAAVEFAMGESHKSPGRQVGDLLMILVDAFNPVGGSENLGQMVAPTVIDPVVALMQNRDWTGRQIYRADMSSLDPTPGHTRAKDSASTVSRALSESINAVTGGNEYRPGAWSPTPDQIDYVFGQLTGGLGRELIKVNQTASSAVTGDELPPYKVPLLGRVYGNTRGTSGQSERYYENIRLLNELGNEIKGRQAAGDDVRAFMQREPLTELVLLGNRTQEHIQKLRTKRRRIASKGDDGFQEEVREIDVEIAEAMARVNNEVSRVRREAKK